MSSIEKIQGPEWDLSSEYLDFDHAELLKDLLLFEKLIEEINLVNLEIQPLMKLSLQNKLDESACDNLLQQIKSQIDRADKAYVLCSNLSVYASCHFSVNTQSEINQKWLIKTKNLNGKRKNAFQPVFHYLIKAPSDIIEKLLTDPSCNSLKFYLNQNRKLNPTLLDDKIEQTINQFSEIGFSTWGVLYKRIAASLKIQLSDDELSLSQATANLFVTEETTRKNSWCAIQDAWKSQSIPCSFILNSLAAWRLEELKKRSHNQKLNILFFPALENRIEMNTLDAMISAIDQQIAVGRKSMIVMAKALGKNKLDPWDLYAPYPFEKQSIQLISFSEAISQIKSAFSEVDPSMADFVDMMVRNKWIEGRILKEKSQGGYCTQFIKSRTPRVFINFRGSLQDTRVLAHEIGHAYHYWILRDLPLHESDYPASLAETASIFAEYAWKEHLLKTGNKQDKISAAWAELTEIHQLLLNIPARFDFEKNFYEKRKTTEVSVTELNELMNQSWKKYYGDTLTKYESQFWMTKQHFSFDNYHFYNFPYTFGGLFALGLFSKRAQEGKNFANKFNSILLDSGRMTAEELVKTHLDEDISTTAFWNRAILNMSKHINRFEKLISN